MSRFNPATYDPQSDTSPGLVAKTGNGQPAVVINRQNSNPTTPRCDCGCGQEPQGKKSKFRMGHDARFKGILLRAHLADVPVVLRFDQDAIHTAMSVAKLYDSPKFSWSDSLANAKLATQNAAPPVRKPKAPASGPKLGDLRTVKVGRWEYEGKIVELSLADTQVLVEYSPKTGGTKTVWVAA